LNPAIDRAGPAPRMGDTLRSTALRDSYRRVGRWSFGLPALGTVLALVSLVVVRPSSALLMAAAILYVLAVFGLEVGYHRYFTHGSFTTSRAMETVFALCGALGVSGPIIYWVATHRRHHHRADSDGDPHSPYVLANASFARRLWHAQVGWMLDAEELTNPVRYAPDLLRARHTAQLSQFYYRYVIAGVVLSALLGFWLHGGALGAGLGLLWAGAVRVFLVQLLYTGALNSVCHMFGSRPYRTGDRSTNNAFLAMVTLGEGWHNNHHAFPSSAVVGHEWYQLDPGAWVLYALRAVGLVTDLNIPSNHARRERRANEREI